MLLRCIINVIPHHERMRMMIGISTSDKIWIRDSNPRPNRLGGVTYSTPQTKKTTPSLEEIALILYLPPPAEAAR